MYQTPPLRRRRPARSCIECRRRKVKCDRTQPCAHCVAAGSRCEYRTDTIASSHAATPTVGAVTTQDASLNRLASPLAAASAALSPVATARSAGFATNSNLPWTGAAAGAARRSDVPSHRDVHRTHTQARATVSGVYRRSDETAQNQNGNQRGAAEPATSPSNDDLPHTGRGILAQQIGLDDAQVILNKTRVLRWSHWIGTAEEFATVVSCFTKYVSAPDLSEGEGDSTEERELRAIAVQIGNLLQKCKDLARRTKMGRPSRCFPKFDFDLSAPSTRVASRLSELYLEGWESAFRIVHIPTYHEEFHAFMRDPGSVSTGTRLKILLTIGIGSSLENHGDDDDDVDNAFPDKVHQWIYAAQTWLSGPLEKDRLNITGIQVYCLTILARQIFSIGGDLVWMSAGSLMHRAMQIGMHRDPSNFPGMSILQAEVRRRLWATILELTLQAALDSALPSRIYLDESDTKPPLNIYDDELDESTTTADSHDETSFTDTSLQLVLLKSLPERLRAVQLLNGLNSELSYTDALSLDREIRAALQRNASLADRTIINRSTPFWRNLVDYLLRRFLLPLHCPFAIKARTEPVFYFSQKTSLEVALTLMSPEPDPRFENLMSIGGGMFREGIRCAVSVLSLSLLAQVESQRSDGTLQRSFRQREHLKQAMRDMISSSLDRVKLGETNIKTYMFSRMVLAQVEAMEEGDPCELKIAKSARDSLEICHDVLLAQVRPEFLPGNGGDGLTPRSQIDSTEGDWLDWDWSLFLPDERLS